MQNANDKYGLDDASNYPWVSETNLALLRNLFFDY